MQTDTIAKEVVVHLNGVGPRGGDLQNPRHCPERRQAGHNGQVLDDGTITLHGWRDTAVGGLLEEQEWHRMAALMLNAGIPAKDVAAAARVSPYTIKNLRAQRWFNELCAKLAVSVVAPVLGRLQGEALASVEKMVQIRDSAEKPRDQLDAATRLLEHATGKPVQKIVTVNATPTLDSAKEELDEIQKELEALRASRKANV